MNPNPSETAPPAIRSRSDFEAALHWAMHESLARRARRICFVDPDFAAWPLDSTALLADLTQWLQLPQRKLVLLARDYDGVPRRHPRFVAWRRDWVHAAEAWVLPADVQLGMPTLYVDDGPVSLQLIDAVHWRGRAELDERSARLWREEIDALLQRSEAGLPAHHVGL